ncbi:MAG: acyltransferase [Anaerolineales bacterium]
MQTAPATPKLRLNEIDLLRFFAALTVVFYHYSFRGYAADDMTTMYYPLLARFAKYGYLGVNLFFIISGFVILMTASEGSVRKFIASRMARLYPAFWVACTLTFLVTLALGGERYSATFNQYLVNMTMLSEFFQVPPIDGAYWSLFVEIKFYLLVAALLFLRQIRHAEKIFIVWLAASLVLEFIYSDGYLYYWLAVSFSAYFIAGAMYYLIWSKGLSVTRIVVLLISWGLALYQAYGDAAYRIKRYKTAMNQMVVAEIVTLFFVVMLLVALKKTWGLGKFKWQALGALTYPLYLIHQHIGFMIFNAAPRAMNIHLLFWAVFALALAVAYGISQVEKISAPRFKHGLRRLLWLEEKK